MYFVPLRHYPKVNPIPALHTCSTCIRAYLGGHYYALYAELNDFLDRTGVDAAQPAIITSPDSPSSARELPASASGNALHDLQQMLAARLPAAGAAPATGAAANCSASRRSNN